ncbi:sialic acid-binding Ig-like lectin 5 isoform X1 [Hippocampus zosterae]|uniref:sialic acid-binding Ig-like lectin 5 isoform X1 n=1 Tax=Hippocampus zosterae TaxID=109293 RepID=UPI00223E34AE|nr:sialic acid-binding Ig-like lectin 5 isoform X1 [Hippocampus zosterae]XP_051921614.1 sialic acid-binding Ig-like lectin 5 isoform X1 [Hippocampus zosterae]
MSSCCVGLVAQNSAFRMFFLAGAALLLHVCVDTAIASQSNNFCKGPFCINLDKTEIVSEAGLCTVIPCSFSAIDFTPQSMVWFKCSQSKSRCGDSEIGFRNRVRMLQSNVSRWNCSIMINNLRPSDSGAYQLRVNGLLRNTVEGFTYKKRVLITVTPLRQKPTVWSEPMTAGQSAMLTCVAPGLCSGSIPTISWAWKQSLDNDTHAVVPNATTFQWETLTPLHWRYKSTLTFNANAEHHGRDVTCQVYYWGVNETTEKTVTLNVTYAKPPSISGRTTVKEGDTLTLLCNADSFPPSRVFWNLPYSNGTNVQSGSQMSPTGASAFLVIPNVTAAHSGRYQCVATHYTVHVNVTVTWFGGILNGSGCSLRGPVLTCVCISGGVPRPSIMWPLLANTTFCSAVTAVSDDSVNSSVTLIVDGLNISAVECVSMHQDGGLRKTLTVQRKTLEWEDSERGMKNMTTMFRLKVFIAFLSGALLSAILCWFSRTCCRKPKKSPGHLDLELVEPQDEDDPQDSGRKIVGEEATKADVEYASINFSALRRNNTREVTTTHQATEYAQIKTKGNGNESLEHNDDKEKDEMTAENRTQCNNKNEEKEEEALYSNVKDAMMS